MEERIETATKDLKVEIKALEGQIEVLQDEKADIATSVLSITKAVSELKKHFTPEGKMHRLCEGVENYSRHWLSHDGFMDKAKQVGMAEVVEAIRKFVPGVGAVGLNQPPKAKKKSNDLEH